MKKIIVCITALLLMISCSTKGTGNFFSSSKKNETENALKTQDKKDVVNSNIIDTDSTESTDTDIINQPSLNNNEEVSPEEMPAVETDNPQSDEFHANSIEQALDFCDASQKFREQQEPENALKALDQAYRIISEMPASNDSIISQQRDDLRYTIAKRILEIYSTRSNGTVGNSDEIPLTMNQHVEKEIKRLTGNGRRYFIYSYKRSGKYMPMILEKFREAELPEELAWLPLIESGFKEKALSHARALGLWQFIPSTGYKFGLKRNIYIDERLDPEAATDAAIAYLKELHSIFGDWSTVLAAYNCGEGRVLRTIRKQNLKYLDNFWDLYLQLPYETARYVPKFIATLHIVKNLEEYGFKDIKPYQEYTYDKIFIEKSVHLKDIASLINTDLKKLQDLNPAFRYNIVPPEGYNVRIPKGKKEALLAGIKNLPSKKIQKSYAMHKVRRGETLSGIAQQHGTSVKSIMGTNRISKNGYIMPGQMLKIPSKKYFAEKNVSRNKVSKSRTGTTYYTVKQGDSLWSVAKRFNTTTKSLKNLNNIHSDLLSVGQKLKIRTGSSSSSFATYHVKPGDSPFKIASKHKMSLSRFLSINDINKSTTIFPGQKVYVE
ncbi:MAG: LysM peptidoglycan-binding domain-containing protein [Thermodesulfobacteriota bacterium]